MPDQEPIVIVGAGPVGLGCALELARFGVRSILIEKHPTTSWHPKTRNFNTRTMEIARGWGPVPYRRLRSIDAPPGWKSPIRFLDTATGTEFGHIDSLGFEGPGPDISPAEPVMSSQELIEEIMLDAARATQLVDIRFSTEVTALLRGGGAHDVDVEIEVRHLVSGETERIVAPALVGADGAASFVRDSLGVEPEGRKDLSHLVNCYFRADIEPLIEDRRAVLYFVANPYARGVLQPLDTRGRWLCQINVGADDWSTETYTHERVIEWVRAAVGAPSLDVDVLSIGFWKLNATIANRFVQGRVLLCGDAAHQFPPTGGLGVNTGLQGAHNAMWKLAWFVKGVADWSLVETYEVERRSVSRRIVEQSLANSVNVGRIQRAMQDGSLDLMSADDVLQASHRYGNHFGVEFGAVYSSTAVVGDGTDAPTVDDDYADYRPSATPGARAPHHWLGQGDDRLSTIDLVGTGLTLLAGPDGQRWIDTAASVATATGLPIGAYRIGSAGLGDAPLADTSVADAPLARDLDFAQTFGITSSGAVLIRPDGHVAWRCADPERHDSDLQGVVERIAPTDVLRSRHD